MRKNAWIMLVATLICLSLTMRADPILANPTNLAFGPDGLLSYQLDTSNPPSATPVLVSFFVDVGDSGQYCLNCNLNVTFNAITDPVISYDFLVQDAVDPVTSALVKAASGSLANQSIAQSDPNYLNLLFTGNNFTLQFDSSDIGITSITVTGQDTENNTYPITTTPEPTSAILLCTGLTALLKRSRKNAKN